MPTLHVRVNKPFLGLFFAFSITAFASSLNQGSTATPRGSTDTFSGGVYIYTGGNLVPGEIVTRFNFFSSTFTGNGILTPMLFTTNGSGTYTFVGMGDYVTVETGALSYPYTPIGGATEVTGSNWTFGFLEGVAVGGSDPEPTAGGIPYNALEAPLGVGGAGTTNDWEFTPASDGAITTLLIGTTFGTNGTFALNTGSFPDRTYSANVDGILPSAEPGSFSLVAGAGLALVGLYRCRFAR